MFGCLWFSIVKIYYEHILRTTWGTDLKLYLIYYSLVLIRYNVCLVFFSLNVSRWWSFNVLKLNILKWQIIVCYICISAKMWNISQKGLYKGYKDHLTRRRAVSIFVSKIPITMMNYIAYAWFYSFQCYIANKSCLILSFVTTTCFLLQCQLVFKLQIRISTW